jgi:hypothetical protein
MSQKPVEHKTLENCFNTFYKQYFWHFAYKAEK